MEDSTLASHSMSQPAIHESYRVNLLGGYRGFAHHGLLELRVGECPKELDCFCAVVVLSVPCR